MTKTYDVSILQYRAETFKKYMLEAIKDRFLFLSGIMATWRAYIRLMKLMDHRGDTRFPDHPEILIRDETHIKLLQLIVHKPNIINVQLIAEPNKTTRTRIAYRDANSIPHEFRAKAGQLNFAMQSVGITATEIPDTKGKNNHEDR